MKKKYRITIHCAATPADADYTEQQLERDHLARNIKSPGGYHRYIRKSGKVIDMRPFSRKGAHAAPYNQDNIGLCYEGGLKAGGKTWRDASDTRTESQKASLLDCVYEAIIWIQEQGDYDIEIIGHGQLPGINKACPSFDALAEYAWITS